MFSDIFFGFSNLSFICVISLVSSPLYIVNVNFFFFLFLVDADEVYVIVVVVVVAAAAASGFVVVLPVLTR